MSSSAFERLATAQALYKGVAQAVKTGDPENLRGQADAELAALWESTGCTRCEMRIGGTKVGTMSATVEETTEIDDYRALMDWARKTFRVRYVYEFDADELTPAEWAELKQQFPHRVHTVEVLTDDWDKYLGTDGPTVFDENGEVVPGMHAARKLGKTMLRVDMNKARMALSQSGLTAAQILGGALDAPELPGEVAEDGTEA